MRAAVLEDPLFGPEDFPDLAGMSEGVRAGYAGAPTEAEDALLEALAHVRTTRARQAKDAQEVAA